MNEAKVNILVITFDGAANVGKGAAMGPEQIRKCTEVLPPVVRELLFSDMDVADITTIVDSFEEIDLNAHLEAIEGDIFRKAWAKYRNTAKVARALSISQPTAYRKIQKYCDDNSE